MRLHLIFLWLLIAVASFIPSLSLADEPIYCGDTKPSSYTPNTLSESAIATQLGWVSSDINRCGGYYLEQPFTYPKNYIRKDLIQITSNQMLFSQHGTSIGQGKVTITRFGQQIIANKAYLYRDPTTGKLSAVELIDHVTLREPNSLVVAQYGHFDLKTRAETLHDLLYRTTIYSNNKSPKREEYTNDELQESRRITHLSAWGAADAFQQNEPHIYVFDNASYSTCPPDAHFWYVKAKRITLDKNSGRGVANNARVYIHGVPILYTPYINFPIDSRRKTGFLTPTFGTSSKSGGYLRTPFYFNLAPNYDSTLTPAFLSKRGVQLADTTRYLTEQSRGELSASVLPNDHAFQDFKQASEATYQNSTDPFLQADLQRLQNASDTRKSFYWRDDTHFNDHWNANADYSWVSDDYVLRDLSNNLNEVTQNQLLQQGQVVYQGPVVKFIGRLQAYQTLHPIDQTPVFNQYTRLPQLVFNADAGKDPGQFNYFISNELTHFDITDTPGSTTLMPTGNRLHLQPGISHPYNLPYFYFDPKLQLALTQYEITHNDPTNPHRSLPIFDIHSGLYFDREANLFHTSYRQTLEPQIYYTYVPYRNQVDIPIFDTTVNTLTYDQLFLFNRFSGLDRIADANQISLGIQTRLMDQESGLEKMRAGIGEILYFRNRLVTLCSDITCADNPTNPENTQNRSPLSAVLSYSLNPHWTLSADSIWDPQTNSLDNQTVTLHFQPELAKIINLSYSYVRMGDIQPNDSLNSSASNLSQTDLSFTWPLTRDWSTVARWTQNWNHHHFQNLLYGLQYDSCCWAVRFVTGRAFASLSPNNTYQYNTQFFVQFALKGLGNYGNGDPSQLLSSSVSGYQTNFGRDY